MSKPKRQKVETPSEKRDHELRTLGATLWGMSNNYLEAVCELVHRAKDGDSKDRREQLMNALDMRDRIDDLLGVINGN